jgi:hypothetical protein
VSPTKFQSLPQLIAQSRQLRHSAGIRAVPADLYRDLVIAAAEIAAERSDLSESQEDLLRSVCKAVDGLRGDFNRPVYVFDNVLYRLASWLPEVVFVAADTADGEIPVAKPKRKRGGRKPKPAAEPASDSPGDDAVTLPAE